MDVAAAIDRTRAWAVATACQDEPPDWWFPDSRTMKRLGRIGSPSILFPLLVCETCPVRRACLTAAFEPIAYTLRDDVVAETAPITEGVWGATTLEDRLAVADVPVAEAIDLLEHTLPERMELYIEAFRRLVEAGSGSRGAERSRRVREMIAARSNLAESVA